MEDSVETEVSRGWWQDLVAPRRPPARDGSAPTSEDLARILEAATTVPDHGALRPWRFVVVAGEARSQFADALEAGLTEARGPDQPPAAVAKMRNKAFAAPCAVVLVASPDTGNNVPEWEQVASASCTGYAMVLAATALGYGAVWKSAAVLETSPVRAVFDAGPDERLLGWVNLGTPEAEGRGRRERVGDTEGLVSALGGPTD